jgi:hypothetical protein
MDVKIGFSRNILVAKLSGLTVSLKSKFSARSDFKYGRLVAILENKQSAITPELICWIIKFLS